MTREEIEARIKEIKNRSHDDEIAHSLEDQLYENFIEWIAESAGNEAGELAELVLTTREISFARWCA